uniref:Uncharacterized protein n=1 Tax=Anguilla anguilla TaxID=7936 RepID=A0A0E9Q4Y2_ANGAN
MQAMDNQVLNVISYIHDVLIFCEGYWKLTLMDKVHKTLVKAASCVPIFGSNGNSSDLASPWHINLM